MLSSEEIDDILVELKRKQSVDILQNQVPPPTLTELTVPEDIDDIQNQFNALCNDFQYTQTNIEENLEVVAKAENIMDLLNYKMYDIQYEFITKLNQLTEKKQHLLKSLKKKEFDVENEKINAEIDRLNDSHTDLFDRTKDQKLAVQEIYETAINSLDNMFDIMKRYINDLVTLYEAKKTQIGVDDPSDTLLIEELESDVDKYNKLQAHSWKKKTIRNLSEKPKGIKLTKDGLLITETGKLVNLEEVQAEQMLDFLDHFELAISPDEDKDDKSTASRISSVSSFIKLPTQEVEYLKKHLGTPLTLALAEITAVQPRDPIHYLGHWLFKYRYNEEVSEIKRVEVEQLEEERKRIAKEKWQKFVEAEARSAVMDMIAKAEEEAIRNAMLHMEAEEENEEDILMEEAKDKFEGY